MLFRSWVEGQKTKIVRGLDRFEAAAKEDVLPEPSTALASVDEVAVAVATAMTEQMGFLGLEWRNGRPKLQEWMSKWEKRGSFVSTPPTKDWDIRDANASVPKL